MDRKNENCLKNENGSKNCFQFLAVFGRFPGSRRDTLPHMLMPGVRRTHGDPFAAIVSGVVLDVPAMAFCKRVPSRVLGAARGWQVHGVTAFRRQLLAHSNVTSGTPMHGSCMERTAGMRRTANRVERVYVSPFDSLVANIEAEDKVVARMPREQGFKASGVWITFDGHFVKELAERE